jgi:hypothetical protein
MVAAHCNVSFAAWKATWNCLRNPTLEDYSSYDDRYFPKSKKPDGETGTWYVKVDGQFIKWQGKSPTFEAEASVLARMYLEEGQQDHGAFFEYLDGADLSHSGRFHDGRPYQDAWLVMMLRGITWFMSQKHSGKTRPVRRGAAIPSSRWDNQRPVWII